MSDNGEQKQAPAQGAERPDPRRELLQLLELATRYPEIGPPVAELAFKLGFKELGERVVRLGTGGDKPGLEFYFVKAHAARREKQWPETLQATVEALQAYLDAPDEALGPDDSQRLLHLVRHGFSTLMFDIGDVRGEPGFADRLSELLPRVEEKFTDDPFYRTLMAQTLWFRDRDKSEAEWERAVAGSDPEMAWNARGTWYKEADRDQEAAEATYRKGVEAVPTSALLMHNLAQVLVDKADRHKKDLGQCRKLLNQADDLLRDALRQDAPRVRRHIHATRDRLYDLRRQLPKPPRRKDGGKGQGPRGPRRDDHRGGDRPQGPQGPRQDRFLTKGKVSLGDMILAKLEEAKEKKD